MPPLFFAPSLAPCIPSRGAAAFRQPPASAGGFRAVLYEYKRRRREISVGPMALESRGLLVESTG